MIISNQLLAAYAVGNVTAEERKQVRQYLIGHPNELKTVMMMMDEDYDIGVDTDDSMMQSERQGCHMMTNSETQSFSDIAISAAAFAPQNIQMEKCSSRQPVVKKSSFMDRLNGLLDDLDL